MIQSEDLIQVEVWGRNDQWFSLSNTNITHEWKQTKQTCFYWMNETHQIEETYQYNNEWLSNPTIKNPD